MHPDFSDLAREVARPLREMVLRDMHRDFAKMAAVMPKSPFFELEQQLGEQLRSMASAPLLTMEMLHSLDVTAALIKQQEQDFADIARVILEPLRNQWLEIFSLKDVADAFAQATPEGRLRASLLAARYVPAEMAQKVPAAAVAACEQASSAHAEALSRPIVVQVERRDASDGRAISVAQLVVGAATLAATAYFGMQDTPPMVVEQQMTNIQVNLEERLWSDLDSGALDLAELLGCSGDTQDS